MSEKNERIQILEMIESGVITAEEGTRLLKAIDDDQHASDPPGGGYDKSGMHAYSDADQPGDSPGPGDSSDR